MNTPLKLAIGLGTLGATGGGAYLVKTQLSKDDSLKDLEQENLLANNSIEKALTDKGYELLSYDTTKEEGSIWNPIVKAYSTSKTKFEGVDIKIAGDSAANPTKANVDALKEACEQFITTSKDNITNLKTAEQFCVKPKTIGELIKGSLDVDTSNSGDDTKWVSKVTNYLKGDNKIKIPELQLAPITTQQDNKKTEINKLKNSCKKLKDIKTHDPTFHESYEQFETWCTNKE